MPTGRNTKARREREASFPSFSYTPTAVRQYPNGFAPIPNLKRISEQAVSQITGSHPSNYFEPLLMPPTTSSLSMLCSAFLTLALSEPKR